MPMLKANGAEHQSISEIKVTEAWVRLIRYCITEVPHGEIKIRVVNGEPTELIESKRKIRFDKPETLSI